jgi:hypothetical protein
MARNVWLNDQFKPVVICFGPNNSYGNCIVNCEQAKPESGNEECRGGVRVRIDLNKSKTNINPYEIH